MGNNVYDLHSLKREAKSFLLENEELIIGIVAGTGTPKNDLFEIVKNLVETRYQYDVELIKISKLVSSKSAETERDYDRTIHLMDAGDELRKSTETDDILALMAIKEISERRIKNGKPRKLYVVSSFKNPAEVATMRSVYGSSFHLFGLIANEDFRQKNLKDKGYSTKEIAEIIDRDANDKSNSYGQRFRDTYHLADYFIKVGSAGHDRSQIERLIDLILGNPYIFPTRDEYFMYAAFSASLKSADMSRQIGAAITDNLGNLVSIGANDVPKFKGGQYHADDKLDCRDYMLNQHSNKYHIGILADKISKELKEQVNDFIVRLVNSGEVQSSNDQALAILRGFDFSDALKKTELRSLIEFFRAVHAEMDSIITAARLGISIQGGTMFVTTFPCHECAKQIIGSGINRVVFLEPYSKSKALDFHQDSAYLSTEDLGSNLVLFQPFFGVGPRKYWDLFSMSLGSGREIVREYNGKKINWNPNKATPKICRPRAGYMVLEKEVIKFVNGKLGLAS